MQAATLGMMKMKMRGLAWAWLTVLAAALWAGAAPIVEGEGKAVNTKAGPTETVSLWVAPDRPFFRPGEQVRILVAAEPQSMGALRQAQARKLQVQVFHLDRAVAAWEIGLREPLAPPLEGSGAQGGPAADAQRAQGTAAGRGGGASAGETQPMIPQGLQLVAVATWQPPAQPAGYGVEVTAWDVQGLAVAHGSGAFDVAHRWTDVPRYGFLARFSPQDRTADPIPWMNGYHLTGVQFYDWMYRHDSYLPPSDEFVDPLGRPLSLEVVRQRVREAKAAGMAPMAYTAVYAASPQFAKAHPDWALFRLDGKPYTFGDNFLEIMNPEAGSPWSQHLQEEFAGIVSKMGFAGVHIDQYGDPKVGYSSADGGHKVDLPKAFADTINATKANLRQAGLPDSVVFNAVNAWPLAEVAASDEDFVYIEVWPPNDLYPDLQALITQGRKLGGGKPVALAAYPADAGDATVRLLDAVIFASGGYHIELGEQGGVLTDPYFPNYQTASLALQQALARYYDFAVRYREWLYGATPPEGVDEQWHFEGAPVAGGTWPSRKVWAFWTLAEPAVSAAPAVPGIAGASSAPGFPGQGSVQILHLINLTGASLPAWRTHKEAPPATGPITVEAPLLAGRSPDAVYWASPDGQLGGLAKLPFQVHHKPAGQGTVRFTVPRLQYWDMVVILYQAGARP